MVAVLHFVNPAASDGFMPRCGLAVTTCRVKRGIDIATNGLTGALGTPT